MKERPILFSAPMVRAILAGHKTQTRRAVKLPHMNPLGEWEPMTIGGPNGGRQRDGTTIPEQGSIWHTRTGESIVCPYGWPGDRLWVRETTRMRFLPNILTGEPTNAECGEYVADGEPVRNEDGFDFAWWYSRKSCPAIHMPRWASRILLEVTRVRVERLNDISSEDAEAEGWPGPDECNSIRRAYPIAWYSHLWEQINGAGSWDANPWAWVVEFQRLGGSHAP